MKWIKNADSVEHTYGGQQIAAGDYYQLQAHELLSWANNESLMIDIANAIAIVAKDNSGNLNLGINDGINYLKDTGMQTFRSIVTQDDQSRSDWGHNFTVPKGTTHTEDIAIPYDAALRGGELYVKNAADGDNIDLQIVDVAGIVYPPDTVLKVYIRNYQIFTDGKRQELKDESISDPIPSVFYIRIIYRSVGTVDDPVFTINFYSYESNV